jgi:hypothetical protein
MDKTDNNALDQSLARKRAGLAPDMSDDQYFETFVSQHVLLDFTLDSDENQSGIVDGVENDPNDAMYLVVKDV